MEILTLMGHISMTFGSRFPHTRQALMAKIAKNSVARCLVLDGFFRRRVNISLLWYSGFWLQAVFLD